MASSVLHLDMELFLVGWYRTHLAARPEAYCQGFSVDNKEPDPSKPFPARLLVVRSDGATRTSMATANASVGLSILAGTKLMPKDAIDAALMVLALAEKLPAVELGNPVAALLASAGPFVADEDQQRARRYVTLELSTVGTAF